MNRKCDMRVYTTSYVEDRDAGSSGLELYCESRGKIDRVARMLFWDATGQFYLETFGTDVALAVIEEFIEETKQRIKAS